MTTLFDYLSWRGDLPLSADPFHEVDGVILARFTYMPFHRVLQRDSLTPTTVEAVCRALLALPDIEAAVRRRETPAGTGPRSVARQIEQLRSWLQERA